MPPPLDVGVLPFVIFIGSTSDFGQKKPGSEDPGFPEMETFSNLRIQAYKVWCLNTSIFNQSP